MIQIFELIYKWGEVDERQFCRLNELVKINCATTPAHLLKESFQQFAAFLADF